MQGVMAVYGNYLIVTVHWWTDNMKMKQKKKKKRKSKPNYDNTISTLLYSTFVRVPVVFYHATLCWNGYANKNNYSCPLDDPLCNSCIWRCEDIAYHLW